MNEDKFLYNIDGVDYAVEIVRKGLQKNVYYRFKDGGFVVSGPFYTTKAQVLKGLETFGRGLIKKRERRDSYINEDGVYILGKFAPFKDGFVNVLGKWFLFIDEKNFYKQARKIFKPILEKRLRYYERIMEINNPYKFSMMFKTTNYGSNSARTHTISLNTIMIHFDYEVIDSVIVHELAHHFVRNHSSKFYDVVYKYCPNYDYLDKKLKRRMFDDWRD